MVWFQMEFQCVQEGRKSQKLQVEDANDYREMQFGMLSSAPATRHHPSRRLPGTIPVFII